MRQVIWGKSKPLVADDIFIQGVGMERAAHTKEDLKVPGELKKSVDTALLALRSGEAESALRDLLKLEKQQSHGASMSYLVALAAMRSGEISLAEAKAAESIEKEERISDALALQAIIEAMKRATPGYLPFVVKSVGLANGKRFVGPRISRIHTNQAGQEIRRFLRRT